MSFYNAVRYELMKIAIQLPNPPAALSKAVARVHNPSLFQTTKPGKFQIQGGAKNVGFTRPPTVSSGRSASTKARMVRSLAGRRPPGMPAPAVTP